MFAKYGPVIKYTENNDVNKCEKKEKRKTINKLIS
jgi:hypothetical protein